MDQHPFRRFEEDVTVYKPYEMLKQLITFFTEDYMDCFAITVFTIFCLKWIQPTDDSSLPRIEVAREFIACCGILGYIFKFLNWNSFNHARTVFHWMVIFLTICFIFTPAITWLEELTRSFWFKDEDQEYAEIKEHDQPIEQNREVFQDRRSMSREVPEEDRTSVPRSRATSVLSSLSRLSVSPEDSDEGSASDGDETGSHRSSTLPPPSPRRSERLLRTTRV